MQNNIIIDVYNVSKEFKTKNPNIKHKTNKVYAVKDVNFSIKQGEFVGIVGNNGAGKSTLIKILCGILKNTTGEVKVFGNDPCKYRIKNNRSLSVVFGQRTQLKWDLSAYETFELLRIMYDIEDDIYKSNIMTFIQLFEMQNFIDRPVRTLSLGQRMRCEIAAAFLHNPKLVFLDEPTIGLDIFSKEIIVSFLNEIKKKGNTTLIMTTHDLNDIAKVCDRAILLDKGSILMDDSIDGVILLGNKTKSIHISTLNKIPNIVGLDFIDSVYCSDYEIQLNDIDSNTIQDVIRIVLSNNTITDISIGEITFSEVVKKIFKGELNERSK
jgi:ABC-2 type transport system ATP-binding protein